MTRRVLDVHAHDGVVSAHALRPETDGVDAVFKKLFHLRRALVLVVGADGTHQGFLGEQGSGLDAGRDADTHQKGRAGVQAVAGHTVQDELRHAFVAFARHQDGRVSGKGAAAACHVGVDLALVGVGDDVPPHGRCSFADVLSGVVLVKGLDRVVAEGCLKGRLDDRFSEKGLQVVDQRELCSALDPELQDAGVLT